MKNNKSLLPLLLNFVLGLVVTASGQPADAPAKKPAVEAAPAAEAKPAPDQTSPAPADKSAPETPAAPVGDGGLRLNFRGVPLEMVLNYLSDAAGFIIVLETKVEGKVDVWSNQPMSKDEAVNLLNSILKKNGYAAIRNGRSLGGLCHAVASERTCPR